ncbi:precorrin-3B C(17)-methyltransferase [Pararhizobium mangrovi]|uniref:Precorrin-3B C(17)-methyltransferase n=1 Tax=Pararhizobium mangrovi TaxID=2590452 RepID=A0A506UA85_9HYPH|nr:precorrin-3B C(17)-methyltransferase [Pararhizobium mangrovi]TPW31293.1 precorrin-3B C(17)-methyltransferase [Pararhizobium mangrovi]
MTTLKKPAVIVLSPAALSIAHDVARSVGGEIHGAAKRIAADEVGTTFDDLEVCLGNLFAEGRPIVALMASAAVIRLLAPHLSDKRAEPPVIAIAEDGSSVVPLLGGHRGANTLARRLAEALGGHAAITTAGDLRFSVALDEPPAGYTLANPHGAKAVMAELVAGASARIESTAPWLDKSNLPVSRNGSVRLTVSDERVPMEGLHLVYHPKTLALGIGAERGADSDEAVALAESILNEAGLARESVAVVVSLDVKADEAAVHAVADHFDVPARFFDARALEAETPRLANPSQIVFAEVGCHGVSEAAALAAVGPEGALAVEKRKGARVTAAVARAPQPIEPEAFGRARGKLFVVGIGPGSAEWRSPEASRMIDAASDLVGYSLYLDLLGPLTRGKRRHDFDLGKEEVRVRHAMELAGEGRSVALVCSGDAGIYAMATLVFELLDRRSDAGGVSAAARRIAIEIAPGISALQGAAARAGAPIGHDFCTISLSDLLTPWDTIVRRIEAAAHGDFVVAFYNPVSRRRRTQLAFARDRLLEARPAETPVVLATNLGRKGEAVRIVPLGSLDVDDVDMLTVVIVGSSQSRMVTTGDGKRWVYTPRGYAAKEGSALAAAEAQTG